MLLALHTEWMSDSPKPDLTWVGSRWGKCCLTDEFGRVNHKAQRASITRSIAPSSGLFVLLYLLIETQKSKYSMSSTTSLACDRLSLIPHVGSRCSYTALSDYKPAELCIKVHSSHSLAYWSRCPEPAHRYLVIYQGPHLTENLHCLGCHMVHTFCDRRQLLAQKRVIFNEVALL